jgi:hypothetical protein
MLLSRHDTVCAVASVNFTLAGVADVSPLKGDSHAINESETLAEVSHVIIRCPYKACRR